jgi:hypothetical protein
VRRAQTPTDAAVPEQRCRVLGSCQPTLLEVAQTGSLGRSRLATKDGCILIRASASSVVMPRVRGGVGEPGSGRAGGRGRRG